MPTTNDKSREISLYSYTLEPGDRFYFGRRDPRNLHEFVGRDDLGRPIVRELYSGQTTLVDYASARVLPVDEAEPGTDCGQPVDGTGKHGI